MLKRFDHLRYARGQRAGLPGILGNKLAPGLAKLGFRMSDVWFTVWGSPPQITSGGEVEDAVQARTIFQSDEWEQLAEGMEEISLICRCAWFAPTTKWTHNSERLRPSIIARAAASL